MTRFLLFLIILINSSTFAEGQVCPAWGCAGPPRPAPASPFYNPVLDQPDPFVVWWPASSEYLMTATPPAPNNAITIWANGHLESVSYTPTVVWTAPPTITGIVSPTIWQIGNVWWIYFSAVLQGSNGYNAIFALKSDTSNPLGTYTLQGQLSLDGHSAIDPSLLTVNGQTYLMYVGTEPALGYNGIFITALADPATPTEPQPLLVYPDQIWERSLDTQHPYSVSEGPTALYNGNHTYIVYSGSFSGTVDYCLGLLTYAGSGDVKDFHNWVKTGPVLSTSQANGVYGPGRGSFTTSPDGTQDWMVYAAKDNATEGFDGRYTRAQPFTFTAQGVPSFGTPVSLSTSVAAPSGELNNE